MCYTGAVASSSTTLVDASYKRVGHLVTQMIAYISANDGRNQSSAYTPG